MTGSGADAATKRDGRLPTGRGLFAFSTLEEAAAAVEQINADYAGQARAARFRG